MVFLVGFMGAGKTSVGRVLARHLGWNFEDLDDRIEQREGRAVERIFAESGEAAFRDSEHESLRTLLNETASTRVVALGGGAFVQPRNASLMKQPGLLSVFLDAPAEELFQRCALDTTNRPLRRDKNHFQQLYESRRPHYLAANIRIETSGKEVELVAEEIISRMREHCSQTLEGVSR